ncbi:hypothetical protein IEN85_08185 [Pelagicoccus sp. NFK12]|uniref:Uncharacterized protein n=1 Tax=Pelagicoccus enzymogenes TaxID=2773457 RepID=A0A927F7P1_9BACT|nr:hypothetical protein [Pelagicoccus enzymogenes]MBD5779470.1 hypothetical protein [Pelagicoccus enzymogenes]
MKKLLKIIGYSIGSVIGLAVVALGCLYLYSLHEDSLRSIRYENPNPTERTNEDVIFGSFDEKTSIITLIATPEKYQNKRIRITGVAHLEFEENVIYVTKDDYKNKVWKNGLWISFPVETPDSKINELKKLNGKYVTIEGFFDTETGHFGVASGTIRNIQRYERAFW